MAYDGLSERTQRIDGWAETGGEEPPDDQRDRLAIHGIWEGVLLVIVVLAGVGLHQLDQNALSGGGLRSFLLLATSLGLMAVAAAWSLRSAVPNLAVGPVAAASATFFAGQAGGGFGFGFGVTLAAAAILGVVLTLVVVGFHVPSWAASLGLGLVLGGWVVSHGATQLPEEVTYRPGDHALYWFFGFAALTLAGGLVSMAGPVRRGLGGFRTSGDPAERAGFAAGLAALAALVGSSVLAACGGALAVLTTRTAGADPGFGWTGLALAAALIGGISGYGRRGGVAGTLLGVLLLVLGLRLLSEMHWKISTVEYAGVALLLGLLVTRLVESAGRYRTPEESSGGGDEPHPTWSPGSAVDLEILLPQRPVEVIAPRSGTPTTVRQPGAPLATTASGLPVRGGIGDRAARMRQGLAGAEPRSRTRVWDAEPPSGA